MEPAAVFPCHVRRGVQGVHHAGVHRPRAGDDTDRLEPGCPIRRHRLSQSPHVHAILAVDGDQSQGLGAQAEQLDGPDDAGMGLGGCINGRLPGRGPEPASPGAGKLRFATRRERHQVRHGSAAHEQPVRSRRQAHQPGQPIHHRQFDRDRDLARPGAVVLERRSDQVRGDAHRMRRRVDESPPAALTNPEPIGDEVPLDAVENLPGRHAARWQWLRADGRHQRVRRPYVRRAVRQALPVTHRDVRGVPQQVAEVGSSAARDGGLETQGRPGAFPEAIDRRHAGARVCGEVCAANIQ